MLRRSTSTRTASAVLAAGLGLALVAAVSPASAAPARPDAPAAPAATRGRRSLRGCGRREPAHAGHPGPVAGDPARRPTSTWPARRPTPSPTPTSTPTRRAPSAPVPSPAPRAPPSLLGAPIEVQVNEASAPPSEANEDILIPLDLSPLLDLPVIRTTALANWVSDTECVAADTPAVLRRPVAGRPHAARQPRPVSRSSSSTPTTPTAPPTPRRRPTSPRSPAPNDPRAVQARVITDITSANVLNDHRPGPRARRSRSTPSRRRTTS